MFDRQLTTTTGATRATTSATSAREVLLLGATGRAGSAVLSRLPATVPVVAALRPGRDGANLPKHAQPTMVDLADLSDLREVATRAAVIVNAVRLRGDIGADALIDLHRQLVAAARVNTPIVTVGGAGALHLPGGRFWQHDGFPQVTLPRGRAHTRLRDYLEAGRAGTQWSYLIPPPDFAPDGPFTGRYTSLPAATDESAHLRCAISYADFAGAVVDAVMQGWTGTHLIAGAEGQRGAPGV